MRVVEISTEDTYPLRLAVLRDATPTKNVSFVEDDWPGVVHLGVIDADDVIVATSTWVPRECPECPDERAVQLRGMATAKHLQGTGVGGLLIETGAHRFGDAAFDLMWARARDTALRFYHRHGCSTVGDGFIEDDTQLPHHLVVRRLAR